MTRTASDAATADAPDFVRRAFPSRIANLGFSLNLPRSWTPQDLPEEEPAFDDPTRLFGLAAAAAPYAAIILAAGARPAFDNGTVQDWSRFLIERNGVDLRTLGPAALGALPAIVGQCAQDSDLGPMLTWFAFAEDGQRLIHLSVTGPEALSSHVWPVWQQVLQSFELESPQGPTVALHPPVEVHRPPLGTALEVADVGSFALEGGRATLEQDHPLNKSLLEQGRGFAPNIRAADDAAGKAWIASIALQAVLEVPYGWHPLDDSRRLVLLHPDNSVQVSLERLPAPEGDLNALLDQIEAHTRSEHAAPQCLRVEIGPMLALAVRGIEIDGEALEQMHLLMRGNEPETAWRARVTTTPERRDWACNLGEALLHGIRFGGEDAPSATPDTELQPEQPEWAQRAYALEAENKLEEAEQAMLAGCDVLGVCMSIAQMYRQRMTRLAAAGDPAGAQAARARAVDWAHRYAAGATSGGEGAALSHERDRFVEELGHK